MNTQQLECFTTLAKTLNYARTAEQVALSQPAVSRQIQSLETELKATLFVRTTRSVTLTQAGRQFLPEAQQILSIYYYSKECMSNFNHSRHSLLRIGYSDAHANYLISKILRELLKEDPHLIPELTMDQTDANLHRLAVNQLDLVLGIKDARFTSESITFKKICEDAFVCIVCKSHPLAAYSQGKQANIVSSHDLWPYRQIIAIPPYLLKNTFSRGHHILPVNDALDNIICATISEAYALVLAGAGFALIPQHLAIPHEELSFLSWADSPQAPLGIYCRNDGSVTSDSIIGRFIEWTKAITKNHRRTFHDDA